MFSNLYRSAMRSGSRLLFGIALILLAVGILNALWSIGRFGPDNGLHPDWFVLATQLLAAFSLPTIPLLGALLINRIDRFLALREDDPASS